MFVKRSTNSHLFFNLCIWDVLKSLVSISYINVLEITSYKGLFDKQTTYIMQPNAYIQKSQHDIITILRGE